jgi:undecaprenyl diphosphate synthase
VSAPARLAIIMDGNGRWAERRGLERSAGHAAGARAVDRVVEACARRGVRELTLFAFSTENWKRPRGEVEHLFRLLARYVEDERERLLARGIRFRALGRLEGLPAELGAALEGLARATEGGGGLTLRIAVNYGGRQEIADAAARLARAARLDPTLADGLDERTFARFLYDRDLGDPDLVIRTAGEQRLSNFLLWQLAYAEIHVTERLWPDFDEADLEVAFADFARRARRFGAVAPEARGSLHRDML